MSQEHKDLFPKSRIVIESLQVAFEDIRAPKGSFIGYEKSKVLDLLHEKDAHWGELPCDFFEENGVGDTIGLSDGATLKFMIPKAVEICCNELTAFPLCSSDLQWRLVTRIESLVDCGELVAEYTEPQVAVLRDFLSLVVLSDNSSADDAGGALEKLNAAIEATY